MTDKKWQDIKRVMMRDYEVLDQQLEEEEGGVVQKEILLVQGKQGVTKFVRQTRQEIYEDPMDLTENKDWVLSGATIVSFLEIYRQHPKTQEWKQLKTKDVIK